MATRKNRLYRKSRKTNRKGRNSRKQRGGGGENNKGNAKAANVVAPHLPPPAFYRSKTGHRMFRNRESELGKAYGGDQHNAIAAELQAIRNKGIDGHHVDPTVNNYFQHPNHPLYA